MKSLKKKVRTHVLTIIDFESASFSLHKERSVDELALKHPVIPSELGVKGGNCVGV